MAPPRKQRTQPRSRGTAKRLASPSTPIGHEAAPVVELVVSPIGDDVPAMPDLPPGHEEYLPTTVAAWRALWNEPQAKHLTGVQKIVAHRWVLAFEEWQRCHDAVTAAPMVAGSKGQAVAHPLQAWLVSREVQMEKCERQLGVGLRNMADLGLTLGQARLTAQQLNEMHRQHGSSNGHHETGELGEGAEEDDGWTAG